MPLVIAEINSHPASLVLDTGSNVTMLSGKAANRLGVAWDEDAPLPVTGAGGTADAFAATIPSLALGGDVASDVEVLMAQGLPPMIDGVLGIDVLTDYGVDLDVPHRRLVLYRARSCSDALPPWTVPFTRLPANQQQSGHLLTPVELAGRPLSGLLDTGAAGTVVRLAAAWDADVTEATLRAYPARRAYSLDGNGVDVLEQPVVYVADLPPFAEDLVIGGDYLATRRVWFSFRTGQVFVTTDDQP